MSSRDRSLGPRRRFARFTTLFAACGSMVSIACSQGAQSGATATTAGANGGSSTGNMPGSGGADAAGQPSVTGSGGDGANQDGDFVSCENDPRVDRLDDASPKKSGAGGQISAELASMDPAPPAVGNNTWTVRLTDLSGGPISNAVVAVSAKMPDHSHPPSIAPMVSTAADGRYVVTPLYFFMPGVWQVRLDVGGPDGVDAGSARDAVVFTVCVE